MEVLSIWIQPAKSYYELWSHVMSQDDILETDKIHYQRLIEQEANNEKKINLISSNVKKFGNTEKKKQLRMVLYAGMPELKKAHTDHTY